MYSATISPHSSIRSDGQLHPRQSVPPTPKHTAPAKKPTPPVVKTSFLGSITTEQVLIAVIAYLLLQSDTPDWLLIIALVYILL